MARLTSNNTNTTTTTNNSEHTPAQHYINFYRKGSVAPVDQVGFMIIDGQQDIIDACLANDKFATKAFSTTLFDAYHRQAGVSSKVKKELDLDSFMADL
jgi:hypothetical protein